MKTMSVIKRFLEFGLNYKDKHLEKEYLKIKSPFFEKFLLVNR